MTSVKEVKVTKVEGGAEVVGEDVSVDDTMVVKDNEADDEVKEGRVVGTMVVVSSTTPVVVV